MGVRRWLACALILMILLPGVGQAATSSGGKAPWWERAAQKVVANVKREASVQIAIFSAAATTFAETYASTGGSARQALSKAGQTVLVAETVYFVFTGPLTMLTR